MIEFDNMAAVEEWADEVEYLGVMLSDGGIATDDDSLSQYDWLFYANKAKKDGRIYFVEEPLNKVGKVIVYER